MNPFGNEIYFGAKQKKIMMDFLNTNRPHIVRHYYTKMATVYIYKDVREVYLNFVFVQFSDTWKIYSLPKSQG